MASFSDEEIENNWVIWGLFQNGGVVLFRDQARLASTTEQLQSAGYRVHSFDCASCIDDESVLRGIVDDLEIERYAQINLDGFNDFISEIEFDQDTGVILVLSGFHVLQERSPEFAAQLLNILAHNHRSHLLRGDRLLTIVQSEDPRIEEKIGIIGGYYPIWNPKEWLNVDRGL